MRAVRFYARIAPDTPSWEKSLKQAEKSWEKSSNGAEKLPLWPAPAAAQSVCATVAIPGSKSLTNRYLVLAALSEPRLEGSPIRITAPLVARDTLLMAAALEALGARIVRGDGDAYWEVYPARELRGAHIDCGLAGTVMRFIPPVAALASGVSVIDGDAAARARPMAAVAEGLRQLGVRVQGESLPLEIHGTGAVAGGMVTIDASASSQFVSGLLLAAPRFERGLRLRHAGGALPSLPHIEMTLDVLRAAGVSITAICDSSDPAAAPSEWIVAPGPIHQPHVIVEPDLSNAAPFLAAAMVSGGRVRIPNWPAHTTQPGAALPDIFTAMGGKVRFIRDGDAQILELTGPAGGAVTPLDMNLHAVGELVPTIAAVAAFANGESRLRDIGQLRGHETNRLAAICAELARIGCPAREDGDDLVISPPAVTPPNQHPYRAADLRSYADHRVATFGAIIGLRVPGVRVENIATTAKTLPQFPALWGEMLAQRSDGVYQPSEGAQRDLPEAGASAASAGAAVSEARAASEGSTSAASEATA